MNRLGTASRARARRGFRQGIRSFSNVTGRHSFTATSLTVRSAANTDETVTLTNTISGSANTSSGTSAPGDTMDESEGSRYLIDMMKSVDERVRSLETKTVKLTAAIKELNDIMKKHCKNSFAIKGSPYEVSVAQHPGSIII